MQAYRRQGILCLSIQPQVSLKLIWSIAARSESGFYQVQDLLGSYQLSASNRKASLIAGALQAAKSPPLQLVHRRVPASLTSRISAAGSAATASRRGARPSGVGGTAGQASELLIAIGSAHDISEPLRPGRNYSFQLTFVNPLFESIEVFVELAEPVPEEEEAGAGGVDVRMRVVEKEERKKRNWQASMPATSFPMNAFAEVWEYEADEDDDAQMGEGSANGANKLGLGILAQKYNRTVVQMDLVTGREASGPIRVSFSEYTNTDNGSLAQRRYLSSLRTRIQPRTWRHLRQPKKALRAPA